MTSVTLGPHQPGRFVAVYVKRSWLQTTNIFAKSVCDSPVAPNWEIFRSSIWFGSGILVRSNWNHTHPPLALVLSPTGDWSPSLVQLRVASTVTLFCRFPHLFFVPVKHFQFAVSILKDIATLIFYVWFRTWHSPAEGHLYYLSSDVSLIVHVILFRWVFPSRSFW